ncbi:hypothetical protein [Chryseobacterium luquanense]|uniref:Uncharacterized protein n=1 Tax=Chryseobacterium luquanense TaxID=2983766 RepID=A0ABT3Y4X2_9FLAO|nr:hypothetical protein [Chryseobacterium luquanense]MCX8533189.1 hypothetical protein [Chryseobacterium luquanense]
MKKTILLIMLFVANIHFYNAQKKDIVISNITKSCDNLLGSNIYDYELCKNWKTLSKKKVKKIILLSDTVSHHTIHYAATEFPFWINADISMNNKKYKMKINGGSYFYLSEVSTNKVQLYAFKEPSLDYFICGIGSEDDSLCIENKQLAKEIVINNNNKILSMWKNAYNLKDKNDNMYEIFIDEDKCLVSLNKNQLKCIILKEGNKVIKIYSGERVKVAGYKQEQFNEGDYVTTLYKMKNTFKINDE